MEAKKKSNQYVAFTKCPQCGSSGDKMLEKACNHQNNDDKVLMNGLGVLHKKIRSLEMFEERATRTRLGPSPDSKYNNSSQRLDYRSNQNLKKRKEIKNELNKLGPKYACYLNL